LFFFAKLTSSVNAVSLSLFDKFDVALSGILLFYKISAPVYGTLCEFYIASLQTFHIYRHSQSSASDSTFDNWRYINILLTLTFRPASVFTRCVERSIAVAWTLTSDTTLHLSDETLKQQAF